MTRPAPPVLPSTTSSWTCRAGACCARASRRRWSPRPSPCSSCSPASPGQVFSRDEILDEVWGHRHVTPGVLNRVITLVRHALGEDAQSSRYLHTVHGYGYRFDLPAQRGRGRQRGSPRCCRQASTTEVPSAGGREARPRPPSAPRPRPGRSARRRCSPAAHVAHGCRARGGASRGGLVAWRGGWPIARAQLRHHRSWPCCRCARSATTRAARPSPTD